MNTSASVPSFVLKSGVDAILFNGDADFELGQMIPQAAMRSGAKSEMRGAFSVGIELGDLAIGGHAKEESAVKRLHSATGKLHVICDPAAHDADRVEAQYRCEKPAPHAAP